WVKPSKSNPTGAVFARMDDAHDFRGWDLWIEDGHIGTHIIHKWPDDAIKVVADAALKPGEWSHVLVTYDGSAQAAGVKVYINGQPQATSIKANSLKNTIRTGVPLKVGQRQVASRLDGALIKDLRIYGRAVSALETEQLAGSSRAAELVGKPADQRSGAETDELFGWWLKTLDQSTRDLRGRL